MIRSQQAQLQHLQQQQQHSQAVVDDAGPAERLTPFPPIPPLPTTSSRASTQLPSSLSSRRPSRPSSQAASPNLRPLAEPSCGSEGPDWSAGPGESPARRGSRDESAFYQAEAAMLTRENQMLRQRIRDLGARFPILPFCLTIFRILSFTTPEAHRASKKKAFKYLEFRADGV